MNRIVIFILSLFFVLQIGAQSCGTKSKCCCCKKKAAKEWCAKGEWRNGFTKAEPDKSVNLITFKKQYEKNPEQWKALFQWLQNTDLLTISKGKHPIEGTTLVASVEDSKNDPLEKRGSESHRRRIDFQFTVKGTEGFALIDHATSKPNCQYDSVKDVIHYDYAKDKAQFLESKPNKFFIFFPEDWHIAKVATKADDQTIRVIVIKVDYKE
nr:YhcH/YjgK/YiaL family protein [Prevotella sp.]